MTPEQQAARGRAQHEHRYRSLKGQLSCACGMQTGPTDRQTSWDAMGGHVEACAQQAAKDA